MLTADAQSKIRDFIISMVPAIAVLSSFTLSSTKYSEFAILTIIVTILFFIIINREKLPYSGLHITIFLFILYIAINPLWSIEYYRSMVQFLTLLQIPVLFLLLSTEKFQKSFGSQLLFLAIPAAISSVWGIAEYIQTDRSTAGLNFRITAYLHDPNAYAGMQYIFSMLMFALLYVYTPARKSIRLGLWFIQFLAIAALILTLSRSGMAILLLFIFCTFTYALVKKNSKLKRYATLYLLVALASFALVQILVALIEQPLVRRDLPSGIITSTLNGRLEIWKPSLQLFFEKPIFGWGLKSFEPLYASIRNEYFSAGRVAHNDYLQFAIEGGIVLLLFLLLYLGFHLSMIARLFTRKKRDGYETEEVELMLMLFANLALMIQSITNFSFYIIQLCILSGVIFSRSYYLCIKTGLIYQPALVKRTPRTRRLLFMLLLLVMIPLFYRSVTGLLYFDSKKSLFTKSLSENSTLLKLFSSISSTDPATSTRLNAVIVSQLKTVSDAEKKQKIIYFAISSLEQTIEQNPYNPVFYNNLGAILKTAYDQLIDHRQEYQHYADAWIKAIEINPTFLQPYLGLYEDLTSKNRHQEALSILERLLPWMPGGFFSGKELLLIHEMLVNLAEKTGDELLPLYTKLSPLILQGDRITYIDTVREINQKLEQRKMKSGLLQQKHSPHQIHRLSPSG